MVQLERLTEHVNNIMECTKIATLRSSLVINELLILSEHLQNSTNQGRHESSVKTLPEKTSYQNENENISESIVIPLKYPAIFKRSKTRRSTGILLYAPPGNRNVRNGM